ncbi:unnamed protein product [Closterium sp. NIES-64]|nr:unnamed protein product [Closterium sp. NIES-64]CAI5947630.1 unnamed protein product [Closterium sp. NIES-64]
MGKKEKFTAEGDSPLPSHPFHPREFTPPFSPIPPKGIHPFLLTHPTQGDSPLPSHPSHPRGFTPSLSPIPPKGIHPFLLTPPTHGDSPLVHPRPIPVHAFHVVPKLSVTAKCLHLCRAMPAPCIHALLLPARCHTEEISLPQGSSSQQQARGAPGRAARSRAAGQQRRPHQQPSQARGRAAGEQQARGAPGRAAGAWAAGQQRRPHQRLRLEYRPCHHTPLEPTPPQVQVFFQVLLGLQLVAVPQPVAPPPFPCAGFQVTVSHSACSHHHALTSSVCALQVAGRGVGSTPTLLHAPPLWPCREEAPGGGLLWREAAGGAAAALSSPSRYHLSASTWCLQLVAVPPPVVPPPFPCAGFQVAVVGGEGGLHSDGMGWDGRVSGWGRLEQGEPLFPPALMLLLGRLPMFTSLSCFRLAFTLLSILTAVP